MYWDDFAREVAIIEGEPISPLVAYVRDGITDPKETISHILSVLADGDSLHVNNLRSLGRTIHDICQAIVELNSIGVRVVVAELDGTEFSKQSSEKLLEILRKFSFEAK